MVVKWMVVANEHVHVPACEEGGAAEEGGAGCSHMQLNKASDSKQTNSGQQHRDTHRHFLLLLRSVAFVGENGVHVKLCILFRDLGPLPPLQGRWITCSECEG
jgi:hypothetical protein